MRLKLKGNDAVVLNFFNGCMVSTKVESNVYNIHWHHNNNFIGSMDLGPGVWGRYDTSEFGIWHLKFYLGGELVTEYINNLDNKHCILIAKFNNSQIGKRADISNLVSYANNIVDKYNCNLKVYFPKTWEYDFSSYKFSPLRLNENLDNIHYGLEKEF